MQGFLILVILAVGLYSVFTQVLHGTDPVDFFRFKYVGPLASSTQRTIQTSNNARVSSNPKIVSTSPNQNSNQPQITPPSGFVVGELSPYYKKIHLNSVHPARSANDTSSFALRPDNSVKENINITGWYIKVNSGATLKIPKSINDYNPLGAFAESDIMVNNYNQIINLYSWSNPFGKNIRLNKCTGYLNSIYQFSPALPNQCPGINRNDIINFTGPCQSFILSLGSCRVPTSNEINFYASNDDQCRTVLNSLNYGSCYNRYRNDLNFLSNEWRVWLNEKIPFDAEHDRVLLFDKNNLLVEEYIY